MRLWRKPPSSNSLNGDIHLLTISRAGVTQVVIPIWEDHYGFAQLVEDLGLGLYATRGTAPEWTVSGLADPLLKVLGDSSTSEWMRQEAVRIGQIARKEQGRYVAAKEIYKLVTSGYV
jgi:hypothetical protein